MSDETDTAALTEVERLLFGEEARCCFEEDCEPLGAEDPPRLSELAPNQPVSGDSRMAQTYNRIGGCMARLAAEKDIPLSALLAVWAVECGNLPHVPGRAIIRFEVHRFDRLWGKKHPKEFDRYFSYDDDQPWEGHLFRPDPSKQIGKLHTSQRLEYAALHIASALAGDDVALRCISIGGPQILCSNFALLGYDSPQAMFDAFQSGEEPQVRGVLAFSEAKGILAALRQGHWLDFAKVYNGPGKPRIYADHLEAAANEAAAMLAS